MSPIATSALQGGRILRIALATAPVNALTRPLVAALTAEFAAANSPGSGVRGILLASSFPKVFSAGLDLSELVLSRGNTQNNNTRESVRTYMTGFQELVAAVAGSKVPTATVVQGACPAGGTVLAMCTDYKVASSLQPGKFSMGLNETRVGLSPPLWLHTLARLNLKSSRTADTMIQLGYLCSTPEEALSHGFLDTVLPDGSPDQVEADAIHRIELLNQIPWEARVAAKLGARVKLLHRLQASTDDIVDCIVGEEFQTVTGNLLASMKKK